MSNINLICDNCGKEIKGGAYWTIGSKLCAKCYHEMNGNPASQYVDMLHKEMYELKIANLEAKLAEKEKEIEKWKTKWCESETNSLRLYEQSQNNNQDKISFAVGQLEKVKELLLENLYDLYNKPSEIWDKYGDLYDVVVEGAVNGTIDNQVKELKEMK